MTTPTPHGAPELPAMPAGCQNLYTADQMREYARAAIQQAAGAVPEGWKLVPIEPYPAQRIVGTAEWMRQIASDDEPETDKTAAVYRAMLAASPLPLGRKEGSSDHLVPCAGGGVTQPLAQAVLDLNAAWNNKDHESVIAGHMDLCRRLAFLTGLQPSTSPERAHLEALLDIWDDRLKPYEERSYVGGALDGEFEDVREWITAQQGIAMTFEQWQAKHGPNGAAYDIEMQRAGWDGAMFSMRGSAAETGRRFAQFASMPATPGPCPPVGPLMQLAEDYADEALNHGLYAPATYEARRRLLGALLTALGLPQEGEELGRDAPKHGPVTKHGQGNSASNAPATRPDATPGQINPGSATREDGHGS